jgi:hypothetical protein
LIELGKEDYFNSLERFYTDFWIKYQSVLQDSSGNDVNQVLCVEYIGGTDAEYRAAKLYYIALRALGIPIIFITAAKNINSYLKLFGTELGYEFVPILTMEEFKGLQNHIATTADHPLDLGYWLANWRPPRVGYKFIQQAFKWNQIPSRFTGITQETAMTITLGQFLPDWCEDLNNAEIQQLANLFFESAATDPR